MKKEEAKKLADRALTDLQQALESGTERGADSGIST
jgi:hypothetical protein